MVQNFEPQHLHSRKKDTKTKAKTNKQTKKKQEKKTHIKHFLFRTSIFQENATLS